MKNLFLQTLFILIFPVLSFAQQFQGGLIGGIIGSQVAGDTYSGYTKFGVTAGGYIELKLDKKFSLQMEMEYIMKGSRHNMNPDVPNDVTYKLNLNYIEMPLLLRYKIAESFELEGGFGMAALVSSKEEQDGQNMLIGNRPGFKSTNISIIGGFCYTYKERYRFILRTDNSLESIRKDSPSGTLPIPGLVRRTGNKWGQFHDILVISVFYKL